MATFLQLYISLLALSSLVLKGSAQTGTIQDVEHVVLFMQENRAFDHYFGTMAGVRGFADPNVHIAQNGNPVWFQKVDGSLSNKTTALLPFYINAAGGNLSEATQCMVAGSNGECWTANHKAFANGDNNLWALDNTPFSWGYFKRQDIPTHFGLAEGWTLADMYAQSVVSSTNPNRGFWASGSINVPGGPQTLDQGGVTVDNNETPGCDAPDISCFPMKWKTFPEFLEDANVTWQVYQGTDNFGDNPLAWFEQFQTAPKDSALAQKGMSFIGLDAFYDAAAKGTLPQVSYIIGPAELSEHPPFAPRDGGWLQQQVVNAVIKSPKYSSTVLMISYDETGGWGDHVLPIFSPPGTPGEWVPTDPFNPGPNPVFAGPGFRLPFYVISPWTRGGHVFTAHSDHSSQIMFMEKWLASKGKNVITNQLNSWRRQHMSDLTQMFDFAHPDLSIPNLPVPSTPKTNAQGQFVGTAECQDMFPDPEPPVPFGEQSRQTSLIIENGFKSVRGALTEGRFLVFESNSRALAFDVQGRELKVVSAVPSHDAPTHRFILHATAPPPATTFTIQFADGISAGFVDPNQKQTALIHDAAIFNITDLGFGEGYTVRQVPSGKFLSFSENQTSVLLGDHQQTFSIFSVTMSGDSGQGFLD